MSVYYSYDDTPELAHYGIRGMKWGLRRYQNPDGSLTAEGKIRYKYSSPGTVARDLNRLELERARYTGDKYRAEWKKRKHSSNPEKSQKWSAKERQAEAGKKQMERYINGILKSIDKKSIKVVSSMRQTERGIDYAKELLWEPYGILGTPLTVALKLKFPGLAGLGSGKPGFVRANDYYDASFYNKHAGSIERDSFAMRKKADESVEAFENRKRKYGR